jgi:hypothetical protein
MGGSPLEELVIKVRHDVDTRDLQKMRADAKRAADQIAAGFDQAAGSAGEAADEIAEDHARAAKETSEVWTGALRQVGSRLADFGIDSAKAIGAYIADTFEATRETDQFARTLQVSSSEMMALEKGFERARVPADNTREAIKTLRENLGELERLGTGPARDSLGSLGLTFDDFKDKTPTEQIKTLAEALQGVQDPMKRTSIAIELMGEDGQRLMPALLDGASGVDALAQAARDAGQVLDDDMIMKTRELDTAMADMKGRVNGVALRVIEAFMPAALDAAEGMENWIDENQTFIDQDLPELFGNVADAMSVVIDTGADAVSTFNKMARAAAGLGEKLGPVGEKLVDIAKFNATGGFLGALARGTVANEAQGGLGAALEANRQRGAGVSNPLAFNPIAQAQGLINRAQGAAFEAGEKGGGGGGGGGGGSKGGRSKRDDPELIAAREEARTMFEEEFTRIGGRFGATNKAIEAAVEAAARSMATGGNQTVARSAGLQQIGRLTGTKNIERQATTDPLSALFGVENLPEVSPAELAQDRAPDVLTATINNTYTIQQTVTIDGSARPDLVPDQLKDAMKSVFGDLERESKYTKVVFAR